MGLKFDKGYTEDYVAKIIDELHKRMTGDCSYHPETENGETDAWWMLRLKVIFDSKPIIISDEKEDVSKGKISEYIDRLTSADRPTGRWARKEKEINDCDGHRAYYWYECDNCGARPPKDRWGHEWHSDYCPICGCRMEGGEEE